MNNSGPNSCKIISEPQDSPCNGFSDNENEFLGQSVALAMKEQETDMQHMSAQMASTRPEGFVALCVEAGEL